MLFARNDQYHNYNTRQSRSLHPSVGRGEAMILGQNPPGQNPPDKTPRTIPRWTKPPD